MDLMKQLDQDMIDAMKNKEKERLTVIREIKSNVKLANIDLKKEMNDELVVEVVTKGIKTRKESIVDFEKGNRQDLIDKTNFEIEVLSKYLPEQLSEDEIISIINKAFDEVNPSGMKDMGKVMGFVTPLLKGKADMSFVSSVIKSKLN